MPTIEIKMLEGRTPEQKRNIARRVTDAIVEEAGAPREAVVVIFYDLPKGNVSNGGILGA